MVPTQGTRVLVDRELYVPASWTGDRDRCAAAGIGEDTRFETKPQLGRKMIERAITSGLPFAWFTADEAYSDNGPLREWLEETQVSYVVAVSCDHRVPAGAGRTVRADNLAAKAPARGWQRLSCGPGSKGERLFDWALAGAGPGHHLLIRRSSTSGELAYYRCWSPRNATLSDLARVAGARWAVERVTLTPRGELIILIARGKIVHPTVPSFASYFGHPNLVYLPITDLPPSKNALVWRRRDSNPRLRGFIDVAREILRARPDAAHR